jgi:hypothetical protein
MLKGLVLLSIAVVVLMALPGGSFGFAPTVSGGPVPLASALPVGPNGGVVPPNATTANASIADPLILPTTTASASVSVVNSSKAQHLPFEFWGVNVAAQQGFSDKDAGKVAATPVTFIRFPGGIVGEEYNYTSGVITNIDGSTVKGTPVKTFISSCETINCHAIFQLPAEIDQPQTAAYYANYVVNTLHYQPSYWEIGNSVPGWTHFQTPWSQWKNTGGNVISASAFAKLVGQYIIAVKAVDHRAHFIALGVAMGTTDYAKAWVSEVALVDGPNLSGISVHSYTMGSAPANPTWAELLANLNGKYSLTNQVEADRGFMQAECPTCHLKLFVTEANGAEVNNYTTLLSSFAGELYIAADVTMGLSLRVKNIDWFCFHCSYDGAWDNGGTWQMQYTLFSQMFTNLGHSTLSTTVTGPSSFYAAATYGPTHGLALLLVNTNLTTKVAVDLTQTGIISGAAARLEQWVNGSSVPTNSSIPVKGSITLPALSISILIVAPVGLGPGASPHRAPHHAAPAGAAPFGPGPTGNAAPIPTPHCAPTPTGLGGTPHGATVPGSARRADQPLPPSAEPKRMGRFLA